MTSPKFLRAFVEALGEFEIGNRPDVPPLNEIELAAAMNGSADEKAMRTVAGNVANSSVWREAMHRIIVETAHRRN